MFANLPNGTRLALQLILLLAVISVIAVFLSWLVLSNARPGYQTVNMEVISSGGFASITLRAGDVVSIPKPTTVSSPWVKSYVIPSGTEIYLTASNPTQTGKLSCSLKLGSIPWKYASVTAPKDGVACAGIVP